jgi:hypothetical protein
MLIDFQSGKNQDVANAKIKITSEDIRCNQMDEIFSFTTQVLPKLYYEKQLIEDGCQFDTLPEDELEREELVEESIDHIHLLEKKYVQRYKDANAMLYTIVCLRQIVKKIFEATYNYDKMIEEIVGKYGNKNDKSLLIQCIKNISCKNTSMGKEDYYQIIKNCCYNEIIEKINNNDKEMVSKLKLQNDNELNDLMLQYRESIENKCGMDYEIIVNELDLYQEINNYYILCFTECFELFKKFNMQIL